MLIAKKIHCARTHLPLHSLSDCCVKKDNTCDLKVILTVTVLYDYITVYGECLKETIVSL